MDLGSKNVIQMTPRPPCTGGTDALPLTDHSENLYETQLMSKIDDLEDLSTVNLYVIEHSPLTKDLFVGKPSSEFNALLSGHNGFQENPDSLVRVFTGNSARNVITSDRMLTRGLSDPPKMIPHQNENSIYRSCYAAQLPQLRNKEQDDQDHEVVIPVNILKLLQDEGENAAMAASGDKRDDIVDFLTSENHVVGTDFPHTPQTSQVNILKM